jgi:sulfate adenylyltransferase subunit 1 (EFTu-like GTPase family)
MAVRLLKVTGIEPKGPFSAFSGVVENGRIQTGDSIVVVSRHGKRDPGMLTMVAWMENGNPKLRDEAPPGKEVQVTLRRKEPSFPDGEVVALEKAEQA